MKNLYIILSFVLFGNCLFAQKNTDKQPTYIEIPTVPPFKIITAPDSSIFTKDNLKKKRATIVMVFSPDCDHCVHSTEDLLAHYDLFRKTQIVMATAMPYEHVKKFHNDLKLNDFQNIKVGYDAAYFIGGFYEVRSFPAIFLYDKKGKFKKAFDSNTKWETIAAFL